MVDDDLKDVVKAAEALTTVVENEVDRIRAENTASQQKHNDFIATSDARYLGTLAGTPTAIISGTEGMILDAEVVNAFQAGHKLVRVHVPANTTCYWDDDVHVPPGAGLQLTGNDKNTSIIKFRRWFDYEVYSEIRHMISGITLFPGCVVRTYEINLRHEVKAGSKAAPYGHGIFRIGWGNYSAGCFHLSLSNTRFDTYDCVVYIEGLCPTMAFINFDSCHLERVANPTWFTNPNCGWIGVGSWGIQGLAISVNKKMCTRTADTASEFIYDFIECWATGSDKTSAVVNRPYNGDYFTGMAG